MVVFTYVSYTAAWSIRSKISKTNRQKIILTTVPICVKHESSSGFLVGWIFFQTGLSTVPLRFSLECMPISSHKSSKNISTLLNKSFPWLKHLFQSVFELHIWSTSGAAPFVDLEGISRDSLLIMTSEVAYDKCCTMKLDGKTFMLILRVQFFLVILLVILAFKANAEREIRHIESRSLHNMHCFWASSKMTLFVVLFQIFHFFPFQMVKVFRIILFVCLFVVEFFTFYWPSCYGLILIIIHMPVRRGVRVVRSNPPKFWPSQICKAFQELPTRGYYGIPILRQGREGVLSPAGGSF